jgi:hypothetical protein
MHQQARMDTMPVESIARSIVVLRGQRSHDSHWLGQFYAPPRRGSMRRIRSPHFSVKTPAGLSPATRL